MGKFKFSKNNLVSPAAPMDDQEFKVMIKAAEIGPFYSTQQVFERIKIWKKKYSK
ncbi:hypothetical protein [Dyadobacter frigoris]|uniref:hypothetical protein n=1 Tax=Dyadobacter frigoris TaxID=2576211 RepID=UPI001484FE06|nr:hypothetical protein [Dyadobacter frigoris]GLU55104.1 hypothetical protein Dfri01_45650 [Dyadobacter frigoris]